MNQYVKIKPGTPDDDNRDYLPEEIIGSDIVVNENGNNSIVYPERLKKCEGVLCDGVRNTWYVYVPSTYDGTKAVPLVVGVHGGLMTGWGQAIYTSWTLLAEREGLICVFPDATQKRIWAVEGVFDKVDEETMPGYITVDVPEDIKDNHDCNMILALIHKMCADYNIDRGKIFMQGMSMGNAMTAQFVRNYGNILAGAAGSGGPSVLSALYDENWKIKNKAGFIDVFQSRPENNGVLIGSEYDEYTVNRMNRVYWMRINECDPVPEISIIGEDNFAFFHGKKADVVYLDIKNRDHGQTLDEAFLYWDYLFAGSRREADGRITHGETPTVHRGDKFAVAACEGSDQAWFHNKKVMMKTRAVWWKKLKYHGLNGSQIVRGEYLCVPLSFLAEVFEAEYRPEDDARSVTLLLRDGREVQFAEGSIGCVIDDDVRSMYCEALYRDHELLVSLEWFCSFLFDLHVSTTGHVVYATDHFSLLSTSMADLLKDLLQNREVPDNYEAMM